MTRPLRTFLPAALAATSLLGIVAAPAIAQTQKHPIKRGTVPSPPLRWEASAVPFMFGQGGSSILIDVFNSAGTRVITYGSNHGRVTSRRSIRASEFRPPRKRPSRNVIVSGVAGAGVRKVKVVFRSGPSRTVRTVAPPRDWPRVNYRFFAVGSGVAARHANTRQVTTRIDGYDASGRRISRQRRVTSF